MNAKYEVTVDVSIVGATVEKQKYTAGPWRVDAIYGREYQIIVRGADGYPAAIANGEFHPEAKANAALIAAAPDLLRVLELLTYIIHPDEMSRYPGVKEACLAAIAKAKGRRA